MAYEKQIAVKERYAAVELPTLTKADRLITLGGLDRYIVQVKRGKTVETIDLLCEASGFAELRRVVKQLKLGQIVNFEQMAVPF